MPGKFEAPQPTGGKKNYGLIAILAILVVAIAVVGVILWGQLNKDDAQLNNNQTEPSTTEATGEDDPTVNENPTEKPTEEPTEPPTESEPLHAVSTATITVTGDILPHSGVVNSGLNPDGTYDYDDIFRYVAPYVSEADYAIGNLETTLCGTDNGYQYSGYPCFNAPDEIAYDAMEAGFDMLLTANNHCYDTRHTGLVRTVETVRGMGMDNLGTMASAEEPKYLVVEINGIKIGMMCYTYSTTTSSGLPNINGIPVGAESKGMINTFDYSRLDAFYSEVEGHIAAMEAEGAEAVVLYIHWGFEYQLTPASQQTEIAQAMCDLGVDVIVGGHPHVIQPMDLLTSTTDPEHKTVCIYSLGNAVSNQRLGLISASKTEHTEDGMLFSFTFTKYSDGTVALTGTDVLPIWVNRYDSSEGREYDMLPLDDETRDQWKETYNLNNTTMDSCERSYVRTMDLVGEGLLECQTFLSDREAAFLAADAANE